jgi:hypothetical protein
MARARIWRSSRSRRRTSRPGATSDSSPARTALRLLPGLPRGPLRPRCLRRHRRPEPPRRFRHSTAPVGDPPRGGVYQVRYLTAGGCYPGGRVFACSRDSSISRSSCSPNGPGLFRPPLRHAGARKTPRSERRPESHRAKPRIRESSSLTDPIPSARSSKRRISERGGRSLRHTRRTGGEFRFVPP